MLLFGRNGSGKSTLLKMILGEIKPMEGEIRKGPDLKISYIPQDVHFQTGSLRKFAKEYQLEESVLKAMLVKMGFSKEDLEANMENLSEGQRKKIFLAKSMTETANLYLWDEPFNYVDLLTRIQIEEMILQQKPTMIFIEHDSTFREKIMTKQVSLRERRRKI